MDTNPNDPQRPDLPSEQETRIEPTAGAHAAPEHTEVLPGAEPQATEALGVEPQATEVLGADAHATDVIPGAEPQDTEFIAAAPQVTSEIPAAFREDPRFIPPGDAPAQQFGSAPKPPKAKRSRGKLIGLIAAGVAALLVILAVGSEFYIRNHYENCIADNVKKGTNATSVDVAFSNKPMLLQASGKVPSITMTLDNLQLGAQKPIKPEDVVSGMNANVLLTGVQPDGDNVADDVRMVLEVSSDWIKGQVAKAPTMGGATVTLNPATNTIDVKGLLVSLKLTPSIEDNHIVVTPSNTSALGFIPIPDDAVKQVVTNLAGDMTTPDGLTMQNLKMTDAGVTLELVGQNIALAKLGVGQNTEPINCSIF